MPPIFRFDMWYWCIQPNLRAWLIYMMQGMLNPGYYVLKAEAEAYYALLGLPSINGTLGVCEVIYNMVEGEIIFPGTEEPVPVIYLLQPFWSVFLAWYLTVPVEPDDACRYRDYSRDN